MYDTLFLKIFDVSQPINMCRTFHLCVCVVSCTSSGLMGQPKGLTPHGDRPVRGSPSAHPKRGSTTTFSVYVSGHEGGEYIVERCHRGSAST
jgi:hypothetical protein